MCDMSVSAKRDDEPEIRIEMEHLETWYYLMCYFAPVIYLIVALAICASIVTSILSGEEADDFALAFRAMLVVSFLAAAVVNRYIGKRLGVRARALREELSRIQYSVSDTRTAPESTRLVGRNARDSIAHMVRAVFLPRLSQRRTYLALISTSVAVGVVWSLIFVVGFDIPPIIALVLVVPLACLVLFLSVLYSLTR